MLPRGRGLAIGGFLLLLIQFAAGQDTVWQRPTIGCDFADTQIGRCCLQSSYTASLGQTLFFSLKAAAGNKQTEIRLIDPISLSGTQEGSCCGFAGLQTELLKLAIGSPAVRDVSWTLPDGLRITEDEIRTDYCLTFRAVASGSASTCDKQVCESGWVGGYECVRFCPNVFLFVDVCLLFCL